MSEHDILMIGSILFVFGFGGFVGLAIGLCIGGK